jgi:L-amino acid N-acyltransferase YncA
MHGSLLSMSPTAIRDAEPDRDAAACAAIYAPHVEDGATSFEERAPDAEEVAGRIERVSASHPWLVAERGGEVLGYVYACPHRARPAYRWSVDVAVYIAAGERRRGHGRRLYEALFERLREGGFRMACAGITLPNEASVGLHESLGFRAVGVYREIGWKRGAWHDVGWWQLELAPPPAGAPPEPLPSRGV